MSDGHIAVIGGAGKMGTALIDGLIAAGEYTPDQIIATARHEESLAHLDGRGVRGSLDNYAAVDGASLVILAVHPGDTADGLLEYLGGNMADDVLVISIITGVPTRAVEQGVGTGIAVVRATPNIAALVQASMTAVCGGAFATDEHLDTTERIFGTVGRVVRLDEKHMDSCTGLAGCGPAFAFKIIEAMAEGGVKMGLPRDAAKVMAAQVLHGAAELVLVTGKHPAELKDEVTTPGGCTIDGITKLEARGLPIALIEAVEVASIKAGALGGDGKGS
jgi:pyrroline-5-carboxylate reductase